MTDQAKIGQALREHVSAVESLAGAQGEALAAFARAVVETFTQGGRLLVAGGGALGALADLVANLFRHRLALERPSLPALSLSQDTTLAAALQREGQGTQFFARQLRQLAGEGDILLAFGDARRDEQLEEALGAARQLGCVTALLIPGSGEPLGDAPDFLFHLETASPARAAEGMLFFGHLLCELVEAELFGV